MFKKKKKKKKEEKIDERAVKMDIECIEKGMIAAIDIYNDYGTVIVRKQRTIEGKHILQMRLADIREIDVIPPEKDELPSKLHISNYPEHKDKLEAARILIVDDSKSARLLMKMLIEAAGLKVVGAAGNNEDAFQRFEKLKPTCVTLDISMPGEDGTQIIKPMLAVNPDTRIIMVSSLNYEDIIVESYELGAEQFISKPFDHEEFKKKLIESIIK
ncbi:response regulator [bacterium]